MSAKLLVEPQKLVPVEIEMKGQKKVKNSEKTIFPKTINADR